MNIAAHGIAVDLPPGWEGAITGAGKADTTATPVVHLSTAALGPNRGDFGSGAVERMRPANVLVVLLEHHPDAARTPLFANRGLPRQLTPAMFSPHQLQRTIAGQAGTQVFCHESGRAFCLYVVLGSYLRRGTLVPLVNSLLGSLEISPGSG